jgi:hypothetical protein
LVDRFAEQLPLHVQATTRAELYHDSHLLSKQTGHCPAILIMEIPARNWIVLAGNAHLFKDLPLRMNSPYGLFGLTG